MSAEPIDLALEVRRVQDQLGDAMTVVEAVVAGVRGEVSLGPATVSLDHDVMRTARRLTGREL